MNFDEFFEEAIEQDLAIPFQRTEVADSHRLSNEALFHLPLLAMTILMLSKSRRKPKSDEIGQLIGECFERSFEGFKGSSQRLGWSANLRMRTVKALTFLEAAELVVVKTENTRISATKLGKKVVAKAINEGGELSIALHLIDRNYRDFQEEKQLGLVLG